MDHISFPFATIILSVYCYYFMNRTLKQTSKDKELTKGEKIQVILLLILNTLISGLIFHFGWKDKLPTKSKQVNKYLKIIILTLVGIVVVSLLLSVFLIALNPASQMSKYQ